MDVHVKGYLNRNILNQYGGSLADTNFCFAMGFPDINYPAVVRWMIPPNRITGAMMDQGSDTSFSYTFRIGPGSFSGERTGYLAMSRYVGGLWGAPSVFTFYAGCSYTYKLIAGSGELPGEVDSTSAIVTITRSRIAMSLTCRTLSSCGSGPRTRMRTFIGWFGW